MSQPSDQSRISNLEKEAMSLGARIEELSSDQAEELKAIRQDIKQLDSDMKSSFIDIGKAFDLNANNIESVKQAVERIESVQVEQGQRVDVIDSKLDRLLELVQKKLGE